MGKGEGMVNTSKRGDNRYICLVGQVMSMDSPMLGSVYSHVKELLRKL
jgi:hypothetical protein